MLFCVLDFFVEKCSKNVSQAIKAANQHDQNEI